MNQKFKIIYLLLVLFFSGAIAMASSPIESPSLSGSGENLAGRKGFGFGANLIPGVSKLFLDDHEYTFNYQATFGVQYFFSNHIGVKSGVTFFQMNSRIMEQWTDNQGQIIWEGYAKNKISSLGIPLKLLLITGKKIGFYFEPGFGFYFPVSSKYLIYEHTIKPDTKSVVVSGECTMGMNLQLNTIGLNFGVNGVYFLTDFYSVSKEFGLNTKGVSFGLFLGIIF